MHKVSANQLQQQFTCHHDYEAAKAFFTDDELYRFLQLLDAIESQFQQCISDYALELTHDLLDDETPQLVRVYWFSKGMRDYYICLDGTGMIRAVDDQMPDHLFDR